MPIREDACPGPCAHQARRAWADYDEAVARHDYETLLYLDAVEHYQQAVAAWRIPLALPIEPAPPARPEPPTIPVPVGNPVWCGRCPRIIEHALRGLDDAAAVLAASVDGHRGAAMAGPNGVKPLDHKAIVNELDDLFGFLVGVEDQWRAARGYLARPQRARGADARMRTVAWLVGVLDDILLDPWSIEVGLDILYWHRKLLRMTKSDPASRRSPIECPRCRERQIQRRDDGYFECGSCQRLLTQQEHDREYAKQAEQHDHARQAVAL
jgi:ribosomal protein L37AE/L43A